MSKKKEEKNIKPEEKKSTKEIIQEEKERYPCFKCNYLLYAFIMTDPRIRPERKCKKVKDGNTPDVCNLFKERENQQQKNKPEVIGSELPPPPPQELKSRWSLFRKKKQKENIITDCLNTKCSHNKDKKCNFQKGLTTCEAHK